MNKFAHYITNAKGGVVMPEKMRFGCLVKKGVAEVRERPLPEVGEHQVLLKMKACNICTTDYGQWLGLREHQGYPMAGGHEAAGVVVQVGSKVKDYQVGDLVATGYNGCGNCMACRSGNVDECEEKAVTTEDGYCYGFFGFSDYCVKNTRSLYKVSSDLNPAEAGFLEPLATVLHGMKKLRVQPFETVVVIGAGTMGLINAQAAKAYGARVIVSEIMEKKINTAKSMGFEVIDCNVDDPVVKVKELTDGNGADAVIVAVGNTIANNQGLEMLKQMDGRLLLFAAGYPAPELKVDSNTIHYRRIELIGTFGANHEDFSEAAKALSTGVVDVSKVLEGESYPLDDIQEAFVAASEPGKYRVTVILDK